MEDKERCAYLERLNNNQEKSIIFLQDELDKCDRIHKKHVKFLRDLIYECESSLLPWQYKWVVQRVNTYLMGYDDE